MALSSRHLERLQPLKYQTKYILVSLEATVHFLLQTGWSRLKTLFPLRGGVHSVCLMIIFRVIKSHGMILALGGWHSAGHLTGVCVCYFCVCTSLVTSACRQDLKKLCGAKAGKKDGKEEVDGDVDVVLRTEERKSWKVDDGWKTNVHNCNIQLLRCNFFQLIQKIIIKGYRHCSPWLI